MDLKIKNKVAIIGGSSKGLGKGCALQLAKEGVNVVLCARNEDSLKSTALEIEKISRKKVEFIAIDLSNPSNAKKVVDFTMEKFGKIDIFIANSGGPKPGNFLSLNTDDWHNAFQSVLMYVVEFYQQIIPIMKQQNWGRLINITSITVKEPAPGMVLSNVYRAGVVSLAKSISKELLPYNITVNNVCPGAFKTDRANQLIEVKARETNSSIEEIEKQMISNLPAKRFNTIEEMGDLVAFIASDLASGITGATISIDGGISNCIY